MCIGFIEYNKLKRRPLSYEHRQIIKNTLKGRPCTRGMLGKKHTEKTKALQRISKLGDLNPAKRQEVREKIRKQTKITMSRPEIREKVGRLTKEALKKVNMSAVVKRTYLLHPDLKKQISRNTKIAMSTPAIRDKYLTAFRNRVISYKFKNTGIEIRLQNELLKQNINFILDKQIYGHPDIFIEPNICIFADGCYWHACPTCNIRNKFINKNQKDSDITIKLETSGDIVFRFWEHEINTLVECCINKIKNIL